MSKDKNEFVPITPELLSAGLDSLVYLLLHSDVKPKSDPPAEFKQDMLDTLDERGVDNEFCLDTIEAYATLIFSVTKAYEEANEDENTAVNFDNENIILN